MQRAVEEEARIATGVRFLDLLLATLSNTPGSLRVLFPGISPPAQLLTTDYWRRIFQQAVLSRLTGEDLRPDERSYPVQKSPKDILSWELFLGDTLLGTDPRGATCPLAGATPRLC